MNNIIEILLFLVVAYLVVYKFRKKDNYKDFDGYLSKKKASLSSEKYLIFLNQKIAETNSLKRMRDVKGSKPDPLLDEVLGKLEAEKSKLDY